MEKWEGMTELLWATLDQRGVKEFLQSKWPSWKPQKYSPEIMVKRINELGAEGWELVSLTPVHIGGQHDVLIATGGGGGLTYILGCFQA